MDRAQRYHQGLSLPKHTKFAVEHTALLLLAIIILGLDVYIIHFHADNILVYSIVLVRNETLFCMPS
jgi:hypothetical protein